jgi:hypothetical protein
MEPDYFSFLQGLGQPEQKKRKRGGLAGIWDRNKNVITPLATGAIGMIPGVGVPLAGAAGAAMRGLDRPGKKGIGFDAGAAARGAVEGAVAGSVGRGLGKTLGIGKAAAAPIRDVGLEQAMGAGAPPPSSVAAAPAGGGMGRLGQMASSIGEAGQRGLGAALNFTRENPEAVGLGLQGLSGIMGSQSQRRIEEDRLKEERRRAENLARFALPMYMQGMR